MRVVPEVLHGNIDEKVAQDAEENQAREAVAQLCPAKRRRLFRKGGSDARQASAERGQACPGEIAEPDHRQAQRVVLPVLKDIADPAGIKVQPERADREQTKRKQRRADGLVIRRQECQPAEADADSREYGAHKDLCDFHMYIPSLLQ